MELAQFAALAGGSTRQDHTAPFPGKRHGVVLEPCARTHARQVVASRVCSLSSQVCAAVNLGEKCSHRGCHAGQTSAATKNSGPAIGPDVAVVLVWPQGMSLLSTLADEVGGGECENGEKKHIGKSIEVADLSFFPHDIFKDMFAESPPSSKKIAQSKKVTTSKPSGNACQEDSENVDLDSEQMEAMYGGVLEKLEAGRSTRMRSWDLYAVRTARDKRRSEVPTPPPLPVRGVSTFAEQQRQLWPIGELCCIVKQWALASPDLPRKSTAAQAPEQLLDSVLDLLDTAASSRHIHKRTRQHPPAASSTIASAPLAGTVACRGGRRGETCGFTNIETVVAWMTCDEGGSFAKHTRLRQVEYMCLKFVTFYLRQCAAAGIAVEAERLLHSSLLPVVEENLDASIQDMESPDSLFTVSISLVYTLSWTPGMHTLLQAIAPEWSPPQRLSLANLCENADKVVWTYMARLTAPPSPQKSGVPASPTPSAAASAAGTPCAGRAASSQCLDGDVADLEMLQAVRQLVAAVVACVPRTASDADHHDEATSHSAGVDRVAWACLPSVVSWASGARSTKDQVKVLKCHLSSLYSTFSRVLTFGNDNHYQLRTKCE